jgi:ribosomal protein S19
LNNNNSNLSNNNKQKGTVEANNNNNNTIKEHYAVTKISPMFQYEAFHVFDWKEYLKVSFSNAIIDFYANSSWF